MLSNLLNRISLRKRAAAVSPDFGAVYDGLPVPVAILNKDYVFVRINRAYEKAFDCLQADLIGVADPQISKFVASAKLLDSVSPGEATEAPSGGDSVDAGVTMGQGSDKASVGASTLLRLSTASGRALEVSLKLSCIDTAEHRFYLLVCQDVQDVGESARLQLSRADVFRLTIEQSPLPLIIQDAHFRIMLANAAACDLFGMSQEELLGADPTYYYSKESFGEGLADRRQAREIADSAEAGQKLGGVRQFLNPRTGEKVSFRMEATRVLGLDGEVMWCAMLFDQRKTASLEARLRAQVEWLERGFDNAPVGMLLTRADGTLVRVNRTLSEITGLTSADELAALATKVSTNGIHAGPEGRRVISNRFSLEREGRARQWLDGYSTRQPSAEGETVTITIINDATREHMLKTELTASLLQQSALLRCMEAGMAHVVGEIIVQVNPALLEVLGKSESQVLGQPIETLFGQPAKWRQLEPLALEALDENGLYRTTERITHSDGTERRCEIALRRVNADRAELGVLVTLTDVSDLLEQADLLQQSIDDIRLNSDTSTVGVASLDSGRLIHANEALLELLGRPQSDVLGTHLHTYCSTSPELQLETLLSAPGGLIRETVLRASVTRPDGAHVDCLLHATPAATGERSLVTVVIVNLNQRNAALSLAVRMHLRFDAFAASLNEAVLVLAPSSGKIIHANQASSQIFGLEPVELVRLSSSTLWANVSPESRPRLDQALADLALCKPSVTVVTMNQREGASKTVRLRMFGGGPGHHERYLLAEDISEERQQERKRLEEAVAQRETLVREVHHRIKNNLQGVAGLLQQTAIRHPELHSALSDVVSQIHAIAQVHGLQFSNQEALRPSDIVAAIANNLHSNFGQQIEIEDKIGLGQTWVLPEGEAVPMALVINELMTNAFKHSIGDATVKVTVRPASEGVSIEVANLGRLPAEFDFEREPMTSSGLGLVKALIPRRGASIRFAQRERWVFVTLSVCHPALSVVPTPANLAQSDDQQRGDYQGGDVKGDTANLTRSREGANL